MMKARALPSPTSMILGLGLLVLGWVFFQAPPALSQTQNPCQLPPDTTHPPDPPVTAQQVEDGSASLMDFALVARDETKKVSLEGATNRGPVFHLGCLVRQEGGPWRSGSIYTLKLTSSGRLLSHAKEMALSGGLLDRVIYAEILSALGVSPTDVADLASPDSATAARAQEAVLATLSQEPHAAFDATEPVADVRPGIPGASGYAAVYLSGFGSPIILVAGFDMNSSHLAQEVLDYGDPATTAKDVVDRETLKAFVTEAGNYWVALRGTSDPDAVSKGKITFRDPNGPWIHGPVYLYVLDTTTNIVLIHAAFPDIFELRPLVGIARDGVTGELILPQVLAAATSSPEGGFVEYFYDDPADDTDSAEIPKVGYAREFTAHVIQANGTTVPINYIVGSGFYGSATDAVSTVTSAEVEATVLGDAVEGLTVEFSRAIAGHPPNYVWSAVTDANGHVSLTISSAARRVSGYYRAQARNAAGEVVGQWHSIPLNQNLRQVLELPLDGDVRIVQVESLAAAKAVAATSGLAPNVPNPFNSVTQIAYHLSSPGPVQLVIYNVLGQPVRTLVDQFQAAGSYQAQWDARDQRGTSLSSGVYITRLSYPGGVQTQRLLYLK